MKIRRQFATADDPEIHAVLIGHDRDVQPGTLGDRAQRKQCIDRHSSHVEAERWTWHVRDRHVVQRPMLIGQTERGVEASCTSEDGGGCRLCPVHQEVCTNGMMLLFGDGHLFVDRHQPFDGIGDIGGERCEHGRNPIAEGA